MLRRWVARRGPAPRIFLRCDVCGDEGWVSLPSSGKDVRSDVHIAEGLTADVAVVDRLDRPRLLVVVGHGSENGAAALSSVATCPTVALASRDALLQPLRWRPLRVSGLGLQDCRCRRARPIPVVEQDVESHAQGCPLHIRGTGSAWYADVWSDCFRCDFFVGLRYAAPDKRRLELLCGFVPSERLFAHPARRAS